MIKERRYHVHARALDVLLHLRLRDELGDQRASTTRADGPARHRPDNNAEQKARWQAGKGKAKPKDVRKGLGQHLSKKAVKKMREIKEIEEEMKEAHGEVDKEERAKNVGPLQVPDCVPRVRASDTIHTFPRLVFSKPKHSNCSSCSTSASSNPPPFQAHY